MGKAKAKLARYGREGVYLPPSVRKRDFYALLSRIDPGRTGGTYDYTSRDNYRSEVPRIMADWMEEHGDWRHPIARAAVNSIRGTGVGSKWVEDGNGKLYVQPESSIIDAPDKPYSYSLADYVEKHSTPESRPDDYYSQPHRRGGPTSVMYFHKLYDYDPARGGIDSTGKPSAVHITWTHLIPESLATEPRKREFPNKLPYQHWNTATVHAVMTPEQLAELRDSAPTENTRIHLTHVLRQIGHEPAPTEKPMKLARIADTRTEWRGALGHRWGQNLAATPRIQGEGRPNTADTKFHNDDDIHSVFADWLQERQDPREELVRGRQPVGRVAMTGYSRMGLNGRGFAQMQPHIFSDGTQLRVTKFGNKGGYGVHWAGLGPGYQKHMTSDEFEQWRAKFHPDDQPLLAPMARHNYARRLARPYDEKGTEQHAKRLEIVRRVLNEAGLKPNTVRAAIANGDRASVVSMIHRATHPALARYVAAWLGLLTGEPGLTIFHPDRQGEDRLHVLYTDHPVDLTSKYLKDSGVPRFAVESRGRGARAYVLNHDVTNIVSGLNARHYTIAGTGSRLGNSGQGAGADSRAQYRSVIRDFESAAGTAEPAPRQDTADVHLARLKNKDTASE